MHGLIWWILVGLIAGWLTGKIMKGGGYGFFGDVIIGILGAIVGGWITGMLGLGGPGGRMVYSILISVLGAVVLVWLFRLVTRKA